jgi:uncharacterized protein (TIGR02246 family)
MRIRAILFTVTAVVALSGALTVVGSQRPQPGAAASGSNAQPTIAQLAARLKVLEDKEEIHALMMEYGRTLDNRDFAGFAALFARDAEYGGARGALQKGPAAIRALLEMQLARNAAPQPGRDYHFFYNETIEVNGDTATALSKGAFYVTNENRKLETGAAVNYHDEFIREDGKWKFKKRVLGERPANAGATPAGAPAATPPTTAPPAAPPR